MAEQKIKNFNLLEDLELEPETLREFYTTEFFQRTLAHLFGLYENKWRAVRTDADGHLVVVQAEAKIEKYDVQTILVETPELGPFYFNLPEDVRTTKVVEVHVGPYPVKIRFIPFDDTVLDYIYHPANAVIMRQISVKGFYLSLPEGVETTTVTVIGWY